MFHHATTPPLHSSTPVVPDSLCRLTDASGDMLLCAERIFGKLAKNDEITNVFLNIPHLFEVLTFLATVGNAESSRVIKEHLFKVGGKGEATFYNNENHDRMLCETAAHDLQGWDQRIRSECTDHEYTSRRRLYMNRKACRSYAYATVQAMNTMSFEWKISAGTIELARWAYGDPQGEGRKCPFKIWKYDDEDIAPVEERKEKHKRKSKKEQQMMHRVQNTHKCPLLLTSATFRVPVHPILVDQNYSHTMNLDGVQVKALRFINDNSKMMGFRKNGDQQFCAFLPCRSIKDNTTMKLLIFWGTALDLHSIVDQVTSVVGGSMKHDWTVEEISELHLPMWNQPTEATNLAEPISQSISEHIFGEGSFGDLAEPGVTPCVLGLNDLPPSIQAFDALSVRAPNDHLLQQNELLIRDGANFIQVPVPYSVVVYDDSVKMPIYLGRIKDALAFKEEEKKTGTKPSCCIM